MTRTVRAPPCAPVRPRAPMNGAATLHLDAGPDGPVARLGRDFVLTELGVMAPRFARLPARDAVAFDLSQLSRFDTAGAWLLATTLRRTGGTLAHASAAQRSLLETVTGALPAEGHDRPKHRPVHVIGDLGRATAAGLRGLIDITGFFGLVVARLGRTILHPSRLRLTSTVFHTQQAGLNAVPIVALMGILIGIVLVCQGADPLRPFGAEVFVVDLIAISVLRELAVLLSTIIVAGRSASAFTAAIRSMKMRDGSTPCARWGRTRSSRSFCRAFWP